MFTKAVDIEGPAGRLEAVLMSPADPPVAASVLCHAHPLHGGIMHFKLLFRVAKALQGRGYAVLRFNFRGVGLSEGVHDEGRGEQEDVRAAIDWLERELPGLPIVSGGFSFGSVMALREGAEDLRVAALVALGLPVSVIPDPRGLAVAARPRLFVQGENDRFGPAAAIRSFVETLPDPKTLVVVPGADHFFSGSEDAAAAAVSSWAAKLFVS